MNVSFDGMRRQATANMNNLRSAIVDIVNSHNNDYVPTSDIEELVSSFNSASTSVDIFNCLYDDDKEDFSNLSALEIQNIEMEIN